MILRSKIHRLVPILALSMTLAMAASAHAGTDVSLQINFGSTPHWVAVPGTSVREIRQGDRTDYDMFQYGRSYYAYNNGNGRWYSSRRAHGRFVMIDDRAVPGELRRVPRNHWRNYPASWQSQDQNQHPNGTPPGWDKKNGVPPGQDKKNRNHHGNG